MQMRLMRGINGLLIGGALFKRKKAPAVPPGEEAKAKEAAIRKRVVDDYRDREDAIRQKEAELLTREEELGRGQAEVAQRLQELAAGSGGVQRAPDGGPADDGAAAQGVRPSHTVHEQEQLIREMEDGLEKARARREELMAQEKKKSEYLVRLMAFKSKGYAVARLEAVVGKDLEEIDRVFQAYVNDINTLATLAAKCEGVDPIFAAEAETLKARCNDPDAISEVENGLRDLEAREGAKKKLLMERVGKWKEAGYITSRFDQLQSAPLGALEEAVIRFDEDVGVLRMFAEKLNGLGKAYETEVAAFRGRLSDPDRIPELEKEILALELRAGSQKQDLLNLLKGWKDEGYRTDSLEAVLGSDLPAQQAAFFKFDEDVRRLRSLSERLSKLDAAFGQQAAAVAAHLHDPALIQEIENEIRALEEEQERRAADIKLEMERAEKQRLERELAEKEKLETERAEKEKHKKERKEKKAEAAAEMKERAPVAAPAPQKEAPAAGSEEEAVKAQLLSSENLIKELEAAHIDPTPASNLLKLAKSFARSKNFAKALTYAKKAGDTASAMKK